MEQSDIGKARELWSAREFQPARAQEVGKVQDREGRGRFDRLTKFGSRTRWIRRTFVRVEVGQLSLCLLARRLGRRLGFGE